MRLKIFISSLLLSLTATGAFAQNAPAAKDSTIKGTTIEVIQQYKPQVTRAPKPDFTPTLPPADTSHPRFNYNVPPQTLYYNYNAQPLRALALNMDSTKLPFQNYLKLGGGNLSTLYGELGIGSLHGENYSTAIQAHYFSQKGSIQYQQNTLAGLDADGDFHSGKQMIHANVGFSNNHYGYYGYNHDLYQPPADSVKQAYTDIHIGVDLQHDSTASGKLKYHPGITAYLYSDKFKASETNIGINLPFTYEIDPAVQIGVGLIASFNSLKANGISQSSNLLQLVPGIDFHKNNFSGHIYVAPTIGQNSNFYVLPDAWLAYRFAPSLFTLKLGWQGNLNQNTFRELSMENPYMSNTYNLLQTHSDEVYAHVATNLGKQITVYGRVSWWQYSNLPMFLNDSGIQRAFRVLYDTKLNAISLKAGIRYQAANTFAVGFNMAFYNFSNSTTTHIWETPGVRFGADLLFRPIPDLTVTAYLSALEDMYAVNASNDIVKLKSILDIGGCAEYNIIKRLSVFVQVTNLLNDKYQRWLGYQAYGINIYGGLRLKF
jgi:hypothetical protein